jgi:glycosyltransferase involved in cell wall biosynthesis
MKISVIIPTVNRPADITKCIESLLSQAVLPDEIIVVDASADTQTQELISRLKPPAAISLHYVKTKPGLTRQRNEGVRRSRGRYIYFFDDDVILEPDYICRTDETFQRYKKDNVGGVMGHVTNTVKLLPVWDRWFRKIFFLSDFGHGTIKLSGFPSHCMDDIPSFVEVLPGGCTAYLRDVFEHEWFDERLAGYAYMEDVDFSYRVGRQFRLFYQPASRLTHHPTTFKTMNTRLLRKMLVRNLIYLFHKNLPHDAAHYFGLFMALAGVILYNGVISRDMNACRGAIEGLFETPPA